MLCVADTQACGRAPRRAGAGVGGFWAWLGYWPLVLCCKGTFRSGHLIMSPPHIHLSIPALFTGQIASRGSDRVRVTLELTWAQPVVLEKPPDSTRTAMVGEDLLTRLDPL